jgi:CheY-like chemotaxis protein
MDYMMPDMDGIETTKRLRDLGYSGSIVALTANAAEGQDGLFLQNGFDDIICKPLSISRLDDVLNKFIRDRRQPVETPQSTPAATIFQHIDGLHVDGALSAMGGQRDVYEQSVHLTARLFPETIQKIDAYFSGNNIKNFATEIHGLKSVLRNIGASSLGKQAERLEMAALDGNITFCAEQYPPFKEQMVNFIRQLNAAIAAEPAVKKEKIGRDALSTALTDAKIAAERYDAIHALEILRPLSRFSYSEETDKLLEKVIFALEEFNCQGAVTNISQMEELVS